MEPILAPSIICMDFSHFSEQINSMDKYVSMYHVDLMDGHFVPNLGLYPGIIHDIKKISNNKIDCHLMADSPSLWISKVIDAGADIISLHAETIITGAFSFIEEIHAADKKFGVVINPATSLSIVEPYIHLVDEITVMTIEPGFPGGQFIPEMVEKIRQANLLRKNLGLNYKICMDGSCNKDNYFNLRDAGTDVFVVGAAALFSQSEDINLACQKMLSNFKISQGKERLIHE